MKTSGLVINGTASSADEITAALEHYRRRAEWIDGTCSACGMFPRQHWQAPDFRYCPGCGALMVKSKGAAD